VVGRFAGSGALAAVGSTSSLINLLINVFVGLSVGVNVLVARYYGAQNDRDVSETVHTAVTTSIVSGLILVVLGILLASMGMDTLSGSPRYDFGSMYLLGGIPFTPFIIGTVGFSQVINLVMERGADTKANRDVKLTIRGSLLTRHDFKRLLPPSIRSGLMGTFVGVLPGAGATTGAFMGYAAQKKFKSEEELGTGAIEGIAASEAANNAAAAGAFAPLLALGIPGSGTGAVLLGGLMMWGLNPGPLLFTNEPEFTWGLIASLFLSNIFTLIVSIAVIPFLIKILSVPVKFMIPIIITVCVVGSYSSSYSMYGVIVMFLSGVLGYILTKSGFPTAPMLLSFVLAKLLESNMRKAFIISGGSLDIFFTRPITCVLMLIFMAFIFTPVIKAVWKKSRSAKA
jgi:putative tricarboxylic transport membrane protein